jgi:hypothetical protein
VLLVATKVSGPEWGPAGWCMCVRMCVPRAPGPSKGHSKPESLAKAAAAAAKVPQSTEARQLAASHGPRVARPRAGQLARWQVPLQGGLCPGLPLAAWSAWPAAASQGP